MLIRSIAIRKILGSGFSTPTRCGVHDRLEQPRVPRAVEIALDAAFGVADDTEPVPGRFERLHRRDGALDRHGPQTHALVRFRQRVDDRFRPVGGAPTRVRRIRK